MREDDVLALFRRSGALLDGYFRWTSGLHRDGYRQVARVLQQPLDAEALGAAESCPLGAGGTPVAKRGSRTQVWLVP
jgi:orotate phosphoribosyltransferase